MQTPKRKPGKRAPSSGDAHMTREKHKELGAKLERLKKISRPRVAAEMQLHAQDGDFSENAPYQSAKGRIRGINRRIEEIENQLKRAVIIEPQTGSDIVRIGSRVMIEQDGKRKDYLILGSAETDPGKGVISHGSPLGSALIGKKAGDTFKLKKKNGETLIRIIKTG
jgi:transcription elongation factor GreA